MGLGYLSKQTKKYKRTQMEQEKVGRILTGLLERS